MWCLLEKKMVYSSIVIEKNLIIRSGAEATLLKFKILPVESKQGFWINATSGITVNVKQSDYTQNERILSVTGKKKEKMSIFSLFSIVALIVKVFDFVGSSKL